MGDNRTFKLRVTYAKTGRLALLSHLEIARALERCVRRAALPYCVSEGFSPHMRIAFGAALPVGVGGTAEIFDLTLSRYVAPEKALSALQAAAPADLMPSAAKYLASGAPAATVAFPVGVYEARVAWAADAADAAGAAGGADPVRIEPGPLPVPETIAVARKKGERVYKVADYLEEAPRIREDGTVRFALRSRDTGAIRADVFLRSCLGLYNGEGIHVQTLTRVEQRR